MPSAPRSWEARFERKMVCVWLATPSRTCCGRLRTSIVLRAQLQRAPAVKLLNQNVVLALPAGWKVLGAELQALPRAANLNNFNGGVRPVYGSPSCDLLVRSGGNEQARGKGDQKRRCGADEHHVRQMA